MRRRSCSRPKFKTAPAAKNQGQYTLPNFKALTLTPYKVGERMIPDDYVTDEGYITINGITFEDLDAYFDYIN